MMKTEKQKMLDGELYNAFDVSLTCDRDNAYDLLFDYNRIRPSNKEKRIQFLQKLLGTVSKNILIEQPFRCDYGYNIHLGENFYANAGCTILDGAKVTFGNNVLLGPNVGIYTAGHPSDLEQRIAGIEYAYPISIGDNVWIGGDATILPGVTIGDNTIIGGGSVVTKDIPANVVAVGNPCRVIKENIANK